MFRAIPSQYCLKCLVISLRLDVSSCEKGLVVHAREAAINLLHAYWIFACMHCASIPEHAGQDMVIFFRHWQH